MSAAMLLELAREFHELAHAAKSRSMEMAKDPALSMGVVYVAAEIGTKALALAGELETIARSMSPDRD